MSNDSTQKRWEKEEFLKRELFAPPCLEDATLLASTLGRCAGQVVWRCVELARWPPSQPLLRDGAQLLGLQGGVGEGFLFSVPAVFLLFNLNPQPPHHSCIPGSGRGPRRQLGPPGTTGESHLRLYSRESGLFSVQLEKLLGGAGDRQ